MHKEIAIYVKNSKLNKKKGNRKKDRQKENKSASNLTTHTV